MKTGETGNDAKTMQKYLTGIHILACKQFPIHLPRQLAISLDVKNLSPTKKQEASVLTHVCLFWWLTSADFPPRCILSELK